MRIDFFVDTLEYRIEHSHGAVYFVQRHGPFSTVNVRRIHFAHPARVNTSHVDTRVGKVRTARARQHIQRRFGHIRVRMSGRLEQSTKLALHGRHVDYEASRVVARAHETSQTGAQHVRGPRVYDLGLGELLNVDLVDLGRPRCALRQVNLLLVFV